MTAEPTPITALQQAQDPGAAAMTMHPGRQFSKQEITLLQNTIAKGTNVYELSMFVQACRHYQLDPFSRQIYCIVRGQDDRRSMTIQISIDGFRVIAERNPDYAGQTPPEYMDRNGVWHEGVWVPEIMPGIGARAGEAEGPYPVAARVGVKRRGWPEPVYGFAVFREYAQYTSRGLGDMWQRMPGNQLAKCAESLALRKAFPNDLSGAYSNDEMGQADVRVEGMTPDEMDARNAQGGDEYLPPREANEVIEGEVETAAERAKREEREWKAKSHNAQHPPPQSQARAAAARPAAPAPAPAAPPAKPAPDRSQVKTVTNLIKWALANGIDSVEEFYAATATKAASEVQNLGLTKAGERLDAYLAKKKSGALEAPAAEEPAPDDDRSTDETDQPMLAEEDERMLDSAGDEDDAPHPADIDPDELPF